jgi:DNA-binding response OmpR family regulator
VEDEPLIRMLATEFLEQAGFKVDTAGTAAEAMNKLTLLSTGVDAVIAYVGLPDRSGDALVHEIRSIHSSLPIIMATGKGAAEIRQIVQGEKHMAMVAKPYVADDLYHALRDLGVRFRP